MFVIFIVLRRHSGKGTRFESEAESCERNEGFAVVVRRSRFSRMVDAPKAERVKAG